ncbi:MAG: TIGR02099 family protein [Burkholderiales bacterium]|nr:TIGR02099 family protein [Burkholderiales bacterium]
MPPPSAAPTEPASAPRRPRLYADPLRCLRWAAFVIVLLAGLGYLALRHYVWPGIERWRPWIETELSQSIGRPLSIGALEGSFDGLRPRLVARDVSLLDGEGQRAFSVSELRAVLSLRGLLAGGGLRFALLEMDSPSLRVERLDRRHWRIAGFELDLDAPKEGDALGLLTAQRRIVLRHVRIDWHDRLSGERLAVDDIDLALGSVGRRHRASLRAPAVPGLGRAIDAAIEFYRPAFSSAADWHKWNGELYLAAGEVDLPAAMRAWQRWSDLGAAGAARRNAALPLIRSGQGSLQLWSRFDHGRPFDMLGRLSVQGIAASYDGRALPIRAARIEVRGQPAENGETQLTFGRLELDDGRGPLFKLSGAQPTLTLAADGRPLAGRLSFGRFDAAEMAGMLKRLPVPDDVRRRFEPFRVAGVVERLAIDWSARKTPTRLAVDLAFERLSVAREDATPLAPGELRMPAFANVSGSGRLTEAGGRLSLKGSDVVLRFPGLFEDPAVPLDRMAAELKWTLTPAARADEPPAVEMAIESFAFANADAAGQVSGRYRSGGKGAGIIDLSGRLERADAARTWRYLPLVVSQPVRDWVRHAIPSGRSDDTRFVLKGDLHDFPYRDPGLGEFWIESRLADTRLDYAPGWPGIDQIRGTLRFERAGMTIRAQAGRLWGLQMSEGQAVIADFHDAPLEVQGSAEGPAQDMVRFVNESELHERIGEVTRDMQVSGRAALRLALHLPLHDTAHPHLTGEVRLNGSEVVLGPDVPPFAGVSGRIEFDEHKLALRDVQARFLGGPLALHGETGEGGRFVAEGQGRLSADNLLALEDNELTRRLSGEADYRVHFESVQGNIKLALESDTVGLASALPAPFAKAAQANWPLRVDWTPSSSPAAHGGRAIDTLRLAWRDDIRLALEGERTQPGQPVRLRRGAFALASGEPALPDAGFTAVLRAADVDLDVWRALFGGDETVAASAAPAAVAGAPSPVPSPWLPDSVSVIAGQVHFGGKTLHDVVLGASRLGGFWRANLRARELEGFFNWREPAAGQRQGTLSARLHRLEIPPNRVGDVETLFDTGLDTLPALDIVADELILNHHRLGRLALKATNAGTATAPVWRLNELEIVHPAARLTAQGSWETRPGERRRSTSLSFNLELADPGALLAAFGFPDTLRDGAGRLGGRIGWNGSPLGLDYPSLEGELTLALGKGQFLKSDPGIAKLIGVVNLQSLRRRLNFDFGDVFAEGFVFDDINANVHVSHGIARTDDFRMRGVPAQVRIHGEANLAAETQALTVEVKPELNAGLASLAYAALANPAIGLGSFIAQLLLREPLQQLFAYEYEVSGPWSDPQLVRKERPVSDVPPAMP